MSNPKVMIIEDDDVIREVYAYKFELEGYSVAVASDGEAGLAAVAKFDPDIILLDMVMPRMGGLAFMEQFRAGRANETEVIAFSNISAANNMEAVMQLGVAEYWVKSDYTPDQVVRRVAQRWQRRQSRATPGGQD
jgi:two-component system response regulator MprA